MAISERASTVREWVRNPYSRLPNWLHPTFVVTILRPVDSPLVKVGLIPPAGARPASGSATSPSAAPKPVRSTFKITDNAIIPLKERMDDVYFDPVRWAIRRLGGSKTSREVG